LADGLLRVRDRPRGGIWRICAVIDYASEYCLAATVTPTSRGADALTCLLRAVDEAKRVLDLDDLSADRGEMDVVDAEHFVIGQVPAPVAVVTDDGPCFGGGTFAEAFTGDDPLLRHVRTRIRSPQTNGVVERFFGTLKYEHLYRANIGDGNALAVEPRADPRSALSAWSRTWSGPRRRETSGSPPGSGSPSCPGP
jgi:putative transposase